MQLFHGESNNLIHSNVSIRWSRVAKICGDITYTWQNRTIQMAWKSSLAVSLQLLYNRQHNPCETFSSATSTKKKCTIPAAAVFDVVASCSALYVWTVAFHSKTMMPMYPNRLWTNMTPGLYLHGMVKTARIISGIFLDTGRFVLGHRWVATRDLRFHTQNVGQDCE